MSIKKAKVGFAALVIAASSFVAITSATTANAAARIPISRSHAYRFDYKK